MRRSKTIRAAAVAAIPVTAWLISGFVGVPAAAPAATQAPSGAPLQLEVPAKVAADQPIEVTVHGTVPGAVVVGLTTSYGTRHQQVVAQGDQVSVEFAPALVASTGLALVTATQDGATATATVEIVPGPTVSPIPVFLGPRTVVADGKDHTMIVAVPVDAVGNPVQQGTAIDSTVIDPELHRETMRTLTTGLLAATKIVAPTIAGRTRVATTAGIATAPERDFLAVAGLPEPYDLHLLETLPPADGHALVTVRTDLLQDSFGNTLPDGTAVLLDIADGAAVRRLNSQTIAGHAEFVVEVPDHPSVLTARAFASGRQSTPLALPFVAAVTALDVSATRRDAPDDTSGGGSARGFIDIAIGPVTTVRGSFVPDGTIAHITADGADYEAVIRLGRATLTIDPSPAGTGADQDRVEVIDVEVLGFSTQVEVQQ